MVGDAFCVARLRIAFCGFVMWDERSTTLAEPVIVAPGKVDNHQSTIL